eukprot:gene7391-8211_t
MPKAKKDPNKPKGKKGPYIFFLEDRRSQMGDEKMDFSSFSKETSAEWKVLTPKDKEKYEKLALKDKKRYEEEMANYSPPTSDDEDDGKKRKRKKKDKDPNLPKRNMSSYFHFCGERRAQVKVENPDATIGDVAKALSAVWKKLPCHEKSKYEDLAKKDKERYQQAMEEYHGRGKLS